MIRIALLDGSLTDSANTPATQHARAVAAAIHSFCPQAEILSFPVFKQQLVSSRECLVEQLQLALQSDASLLHCSLGFPTPDHLTQQAFALACQQFRLVVASAPARGTPIYPAQYQGVIKASGDARCAEGEYSYLGTAYVDFAASPHQVGGGQGGASIAAGRITGLLAQACLEQRADLELLKQKAHYKGIERRR